MSQQLLVQQNHRLLAVYGLILTLLQIQTLASMPDAASRLASPLGFQSPLKLHPPILNVRKRLFHLYDLLHLLDQFRSQLREVLGRPYVVLPHLKKLSRKKKMISTSFVGVVQRFDQLTKEQFDLICERAWVLGN
jgi:hypothetical protein